MDIEIERRQLLKRLHEIDNELKSKVDSCIDVRARSGLIIPKDYLPIMLGEIHDHILSMSRWPKFDPVAYKQVFIDGKMEQFNRWFLEI